MMAAHHGSVLALVVGVGEHVRHRASRAGIRPRLNRHPARRPRAVLLLGLDPEVEARLVEHEVWTVDTDLERAAAIGKIKIVQLQVELIVVVVFGW